MKKYFAFFLSVFVSINVHSQVLGNLASVYPNTATQGQTLTTTITQQAGSYLLGSPPCDNYGIFLLQGTDTIFSNLYNWQWMDIVDAEFTIPAAAPLGFYDLYVASAHYDWWWGTCTTLGYWVLYNGFEVTTNTNVLQNKQEQINPVIYPNPFCSNGTLSFSNKERNKYVLAIMDSFGRKVYNAIVNTSRVSLEGKGLEEGVYYYTLEGMENKFSFTGKFAVIK